MKFLKYLAVALILVMPLGTQAQTNELKLFLEKFRTYAEAHYPKVKWNMPIAKPENGSYSMLRADVEGFMEDPKTGLRYYAGFDVVYDPETGYYLEYDPEAKYFVDIKAGKIYKGQAEVKVENKRPK